MKRNIKEGMKRTAFYRFAFITLIAVYILIVVGGVVRSTGSGMGCPDWPTCFGQWVPPTEESQLPEDYKEKYTEKRILKNEKLARYLEALGMSSKARQVREDEMVFEEQDFNKYKTWTEYVNRLVGATLGLLVTATFIASIRYLKSVPSLFWISLGILLLTGFQGWIGSLVVSTNLLPWMVTVHMLITFVIVAGLIFLVYKCKGADTGLWPGKGTILLLILCMGTLILQVIYGTQVREGIDTVAYAMGFNNRDVWIGQLDWQFYFHRSFSWVILVLHALLTWKLWNVNEKLWSTSLLGVIILSALTGALMGYFAIPPALQPIHLVLAFIAFGIQFYLLLFVRKDVDVEVVKG